MRPRHDVEVGTYTKDPDMKHGAYVRIFLVVFESPQSIEYQ